MDAVNPAAFYLSRGGYLRDNKPLVDALLDRLQHHCITIRIDGPSLRASTAGDASAAPAAPAERERGRTPEPAPKAQ